MSIFNNMSLSYRFLRKRQAQRRQRKSSVSVSGFNVCLFPGRREREWQDEGEKTSGKGFQ